MLAKQEAILFRVQTRYAKSGVLYVAKVRFKKTKKYEKSEKLKNEISISVKIIISFNACSRHMRYFFWDLHKDTQRKFLPVSQGQNKKNRFLLYNLNKKVKKLLYFDLICSFQGRVADMKNAEC